MMSLKDAEAMATRMGFAPDENGIYRQGYPWGGAYLEFRKTVNGWTFDQRETPEEMEPLEFDESEASEIAEFLCIDVIRA